MDTIAFINQITGGTNKGVKNVTVKPSLMQGLEVEKPGSPGAEDPQDTVEVSSKSQYGSKPTGATGYTNPYSSLFPSLPVTSFTGVNNAGASAFTWPDIPSFTPPVIPNFPQVNSNQGMPSDLAESAQFLEMMRQLKQNALATSGVNSNNKINPNNTGKDKGTLRVTAKGYYEGDTYHPVESIRIQEYGNYKNRAYDHFTNYGYNPEHSLSLRTAQKGKYYTVTVSWEGGDTRTYDVKMEKSGTTQNYTIWR